MKDENGRDDLVKEHGKKRKRKKGRQEEKKDRNLFLFLNFFHQNYVKREDGIKGL